MEATSEVPVADPQAVMADRILDYWRLVEYAIPPTPPQPGTDDTRLLAPDAPLPWEAPGAPQDTADETVRHVIYFGLARKSDVEDDLARAYGGADDHFTELPDNSMTALAGLTFDAHGRWTGGAACHSFGWAIARAGGNSLKGKTWAEIQAEVDMMIRETLSSSAVTRKELQAERFLAFPPEQLKNPDTRHGYGLPPLPEPPARGISLITGEPGPATMTDIVRRFPKLGLMLTKMGLPVHPSAAVPATRATLDRMRARIYGAVGWTPGANEDILLVNSGTVMVRRKRGVDKWREPSPDIVPSFIVGDIERLKSEVATSGLTTHASRYLFGVAAEDRRDVGESLDLAAALVDPARHPDGRWPAPGHHPLVYGQQLAVNASRVLAGVDTGASLFSVNGPPGTGKTTLLRDVVAGIVTDRAHVLAAFKDPRQAMKPYVSASIRQHARKLGIRASEAPPSLNAYALHPKLRGFEMVVVSSNNAAVENVTREIPGVGAVDASWLGRTDYFSEAAGRLLGSVDADDDDDAQDDLFAEAGGDEPETQCWAMMAAILGNKGNRMRFVQRFMGKPKDKVGNGKTRKGPRGFRELLENMPEADWDEARARFRGAVEQARKLLSGLEGPAAADLACGGAEQLLAPGHSPEAHAARAEVFLAALDLHKAFLVANRDRVIANLSLLAGHLLGEDDADLLDNPEAYKEIWATLFLAVPVVSTTFASYGPMFSRLGPGDIGWTLVDEAGQAVPQAACGVLLRSRNVVAVGDPRQIKPVVPLRPSVLDAMRQYQELPSKRWNPDVNSLQVLADGGNPIGRMIPELRPDGTRKSTWSGAPLLVHRRCADPMFTISNEVSYGGLMVHGGDPVPPAPGPFGDSRWVDVRSGEAREHYILAEGREIQQLVGRARAAGRLPDVFVITPFKTAAAGMRRDLIKMGYPADWVRARVGTVHTFQGKEADTVIFMLGGNPGRPGALTWAASEPNLLNVAVSRAKKTLVVVGDLGRWHGLPFFEILAARLNAKPKANRDLLNVFP